MRVALLILAAYAFVGWNNAQAETLANGYYRVSPTVIATASVKGDEVFAELITNLSESNIVNAPQSVAMKIYGSCSLRQYTRWGMAFFSDQWKGGFPMMQFEADNINRRAERGGPIAAVFDKECAK